VVWMGVLACQAMIHDLTRNQRIVTTPQPAPGKPDDAIDAEWRKIESERIAEEQEEAREDILAPEPARPIWPWWVFAAILAAGAVFAAAINAPVLLSRQPRAPGGEAGGGPAAPDGRP
jgi:hypothetical protein